MGAAELKTKRTKVKPAAPASGRVTRARVPYIPWPSLRSARPGKDRAVVTTASGTDYVDALSLLRTELAQSRWARSETRLEEAKGRARELIERLRNETAARVEKSARMRNLAQRPRKKGVTKEDVLAHRAQWEKAHDTMRGWVSVAARKFDLTKATIRKRMGQ